MKLIQNRIQKNFRLKVDSIRKLDLLITSKELYGNWILDKLISDEYEKEFKGKTDYLS